MGLIILVLMFGVIYALFIVPQKRRMNAHRALLADLEVGDMVVTSSGIYGAIAEIESEVVWLEVAPEIELKISKAAVTERLLDGETGDQDEELEAADAGDDEG